MRRRCIGHRQARKAVPLDGRAWNETGSCLNDALSEASPWCARWEAVTPPTSTPSSKPMSTLFAPPSTRGPELSGTPRTGCVRARSSRRTTQSSSRSMSASLLPRRILGRAFGPSRSSTANHHLRERTPARQLRCWRIGIHDWTLLGLGLGMLCHACCGGVVVSTTHGYVICACPFAKLASKALKVRS